MGDDLFVVVERCHDPEYGKQQHEQKSGRLPIESVKAIGRKSDEIQDGQGPAGEYGAVVVVIFFQFDGKAQEAQTGQVPQDDTSHGTDQVVLNAVFGTYGDPYDRNGNADFVDKVLADEFFDT